MHLSPHHTGVEVPLFEKGVGKGGVTLSVGGGSGSSLQCQGLSSISRSSSSSSLASMRGGGGGLEAPLSGAGGGGSVGAGGAGGGLRGGAAGKGLSHGKGKGLLALHLPPTPTFSVSMHVR